MHPRRGDGIAMLFIHVWFINRKRNRTLEAQPSTKA